MKYIIIATIIGILGLATGVRAIINEINFYDYKAQINLQEGFVRIYQANVDKATCWVAVTTYPKQIASSGISCISNKAF